MTVSRVFIALANSFGFTAKATTPVSTSTVAVATNNVDEDTPPSLLDWEGFSSNSGILGGSRVSDSSSSSPSSFSSSSSSASSSSS